MTLELDREDLKALVKGMPPYYDVFEHPLVQKAGYQYFHNLGTSDWNNLDDFTEDELYQLFVICKNSWPY
jgi:hypothetical protein